MASGSEYSGASLVGGRPAISSLRWWIAAMLFVSTAINYIDRQTLSLLAPYFKRDFHWTNTDYANIVVAFRVAYSIGQTVCGRLMDRLGTKRGLTITVLWYSLSPCSRQWREVSTVSLDFDFFSGRENPEIGPAQQKPCLSGFQNTNAHWQLRSSTVVLRSVAPWRRSWCCHFTSVGE